MSTSLLHRRADAFARALGAGELADDPVISTFARLAEDLDQIGPDPRFRTALRSRLLAVAAVAPTVEQAAAPVRIRRRQRLYAFAGAASALMIAAAGAGVGASRSLPGQPLYGLKLGAEALQLDLTSGNLARGQLELEFARTRLTEVRALLRQAQAIGASSAWPLAAGGALPPGTAAEVNSTLRRMDEETLAGSRYLTRAYMQSGQIRALAILVDFAHAQDRALVALLPTVPASVQSQIRRAIQVLAQVDGTAVRLATTSANGRSGSGGQAGTSGSRGKSAGGRGRTGGGSSGPGSGTGSTSGQVGVGPSGSDSQSTGQLPSSLPTLPTLPPTPSTPPPSPLPTSPLPTSPLPTSILPSLPLPTSPLSSLLSLL
jgi:uncharacterized membrane protein YgcG